MSKFIKTGVNKIQKWVGCGLSQMKFLLTKYPLTGAHVFIGVVFFDIQIIAGGFRPTISPFFEVPVWKYAFIYQ